jgi:hypothetical protein
MIRWVSASGRLFNVLTFGVAVACAACAPLEPDEPSSEKAPDLGIPHDDWRAVTVADGALILRGAIAEDLHELLAWDLVRASPRWDVRLRWILTDPWRGSDMYDAEDVLVFVLPTGVAALGTADGRERWHVLDGAQVEGVGVANGAFYAIVDYERLVALDLRDGRERDSFGLAAAQNHDWPLGAVIAPGGRFAKFEVASCLDSTDYRMQLVPRLGPPVEVAKLPAHEPFACLLSFGVPGSPRVRADVELRFRGDLDAPKLEGYSNATRGLLWSTPLSAPAARVVRADEGWRTPVVLWDGGPWFFTREDTSIYELRRTESAETMCVLSFEEELGSASMRATPRFVVLSSTHWLRVYDVADCSVRWSGPALSSVDAFSVDFDARHVIIMQDPPRYKAREEWGADWLRVIDLE